MASALSSLDNPVWAALNGPQAAFAQGGALARRYDPVVSPFAGFGSGAFSSARLDLGPWEEMRDLVGADATLLLTEQPTVLPRGWQVEVAIPGVQMIATAELKDEPEREAIGLGADDVPEMLDLVDRTKPGPFLPRTHELGAYLGIRSGDRLIAMGGERMHPPGATEISAVCTDSEFRGSGLARRLVNAVAHGIRQRGEIPFLHAAGSNVNAIRLYQAMGFEVRREVTFVLLRTP
jgi:ribosomal protein S18 acetylase RimI-like enzyme